MVIQIIEKNQLFLVSLQSTPENFIKGGMIQHNVFQDFSDFSFHHKIIMYAVTPFVSSPKQMFLARSSCVP